MRHCGILLGICILVGGCMALEALADPLDPTTFASIAPTLGPGYYVLTSTVGTPTLSVTDGSGNPLGPTYTGVISNGVAVFTFDSINLSSGSYIAMGAGHNTHLNIGFNGTVDGTKLTNPVAFLSKGDVSLTGIIDVSGGINASLNQSQYFSSYYNGPGTSSLSHPSANYYGAGVGEDTAERVAIARSALTPRFRGGLRPGVSLMVI